MVAIRRLRGPTTGRFCMAIPPGGSLHPRERRVAESARPMALTPGTSLEPVRSAPRSAPAGCAKCLERWTWPLAARERSGNPPNHTRNGSSAAHHPVCTTHAVESRRSQGRMRRLAALVWMAALGVAAEAGAQGIVKCAPVPQATLDANKQLLIDFFESGRT